MVQYSVCFDRLNRTITLNYLQLRFISSILRHLKYGTGELAEGSVTSLAMPSVWGWGSKEKLAVACL